MKKLILPIITIMAVCLLAVGCKKEEEQELGSVDYNTPGKYDGLGVSQLPYDTVTGEDADKLIEEHERDLEQNPPQPDDATYPTPEFITPPPLEETPTPAATPQIVTGKEQVDGVEYDNATTNMCVRFISFSQNGATVTATVQEYKEVYVTQERITEDGRKYDGYQLTMEPVEGNTFTFAMRPDGVFKHWDPASYENEPLSTALPDFMNIANGKAMNGDPYFYKVHIEIGVIETAELYRDYYWVNMPQPTAPIMTPYSGGNYIVNGPTATPDANGIVWE